RRDGDEPKTVDAAPSRDERRLPTGDVALHIRDLDAHDEDKPVEKERERKSEESEVERPLCDEVACARHQEAEGDHVRDLTEFPVREREWRRRVEPPEEVACDG